MINFIRTIIIISKYSLLSKYYEINKFKIQKFLFRTIEIIFYPLNIIKNPNKDFGVCLREAFKELGPIYIKLGQTISANPKLAGTKISEELKLLQDQLEPFEFKYVKQSIYSSFGKDIDQLFSEFDHIPVSAASISQVHKAKTKEGVLVAVKILRPNIHKRYNNDIKLLSICADIIDKYTVKYKRLNLKEVINILRKVMNDELNLLVEAASASKLADNLKNDDIVYIPKIYWALTSKYVITSEWIIGSSIYTIINADKLYKEEIVRKMAVIFFNQAFRDGFFHADLHPGNILIMNEGVIGLVDFGIMGNLSEKERLILAEILYKFLMKDYIAIAKLHVKAGYIDENSNLELFAQNCKLVYEQLITSDPSSLSIAQLLQNLFKITEDFGMKTQPQLILLQKTMIVVEGIGRLLCPDQNMWELATLDISKWAKKNLCIEAKILRFIKNIFYKIDLY